MILLPLSTITTLGTHIHTHIQTDGHGDSMTDLAQRAKLVKIYISGVLTFSQFHKLAELGLTVNINLLPGDPFLESWRAFCPIRKVITSASIIRLKYFFALIVLPDILKFILKIVCH